MPATIDNDLWQSFKSGDTDAFQQIYDDHFSSLFQYGTRLVRNSDLVKDAIQDLFVKLWNNKSNLGDVIHIRPYLVVSLRGNLFNKLAREKRIIEEEVSDEMLPFEMQFSTESELLRRETDQITIQRLLDGLNKLTSRQKEILYLRFYLELTYEEVAEVMHISVKATYKLNARALEALKEVLGAILFSFFIDLMR